MAVAGLVLSILALVGSILSWLPIVGYLALPLAIVAVILSALAMKKQPEKKGMAIAGLVMGIIALVLSGILTIACTICVAAGAAGAGACKEAVSFAAAILTL